MIDSGLSREEAVHKYLHLVKYVAGRISVNLPASVDINDLINDGVFGLIDAIEKYDSSRTVKFETYAITRINGAIIDALRSLDWVPRAIRQRARELTRAYEALELELGRAPSREELAGRLRLSPQELDRLLGRVRTRAILPLEAASAVLDDAGDVERELEHEELHAELERAVDALLPQERVVIRGYYFEGRTLKEIKSTLGVSESRVSQIHARAVRRLRQRLHE
ncbi:MAG: FliA/WhiG family RNA polymerase sigma factor [Candidatus Eremiobacteraeota bacterium]|nr:FliA/WhiG family RNA polymerase sigma factor [Candidatus Eremiobacteraeota bacterium]MBV8499866.1 FliA/WhiG family RNA polymerase sigma factor [Candidatus Eremiobacteraeota bacterium]